MLFVSKEILLLVKTKEKKLLKIQPLPKVLRVQAVCQSLERSKVWFSHRHKILFWDGALALLQPKKMFLFGFLSALLLVVRSYVCCKHMNMYVCTTQPCHGRRRRAPVCMCVCCWFLEHITTSSTIACKLFCTYARTAAKKICELLRVYE